MNNSFFRTYAPALNDVHGAWCMSIYHSPLKEYSRDRWQTSDQSIQFEGFLSTQTNEVVNHILNTYHCNYHNTTWLSYWVRSQLNAPMTVFFFINYEIYESLFRILYSELHSITYDILYENIELLCNSSHAYME